MWVWDRNIWICFDQSAKGSMKLKIKAFFSTMQSNFFKRQVLTSGDSDNEHMLDTTEEFM